MIAEYKPTGIRAKWKWKPVAAGIGGITVERRDGKANSPALPARRLKQTELPDILTATARDLLPVARLWLGGRISYREQADYRRR